MPLLERGATLAVVVAMAARHAAWTDSALRLSAKTCRCLGRWGSSVHACQVAKKVGRSKSPCATHQLVWPCQAGSGLVGADKEGVTPNQALGGT